MGETQSSARRPADDVVHRPPADTAPLDDGARANATQAVLRRVAVLRAAARQPGTVERVGEASEPRIESGADALVARIRRDEMIGAGARLLEMRGVARGRVQLEEAGQ